MRVCFLISQLQAGGAERVVSELANYFAESDIFEVYIVSVEDKELFYNISGKVNVSNLGVKNNKNPFFNSFQRITKTYKSLKSISPEVVISFMTSTNIETTIVSKLLNIPVIISERNNPKENTPNIWKILRKTIYPFSSALVCQTIKSAEFYRKWIKNIIVINNPIRNINKTTVQKDKVVLAVGSFRHQKGFDVLIDSFAKIEKKYSDEWKLIIVGEGKERNFFEKKIKAFGFEKNIMLPGKTNKIDEYYSKASIFVLSSRWEGMPNVLMEAMAHGLPCIAFDCNYGPAELIENEITGILVPPENGEKLTKMMEILMIDEGKRKFLGENAKKITQTHSLGIIAGKWEKLIKLTSKNEN